MECPFVEAAAFGGTPSLGVPCHFADSSLICEASQRQTESRSLGVCGGEGAGEGRVAFNMGVAFLRLLAGSKKHHNLERELQPDGHLWRSKSVGCSQRVPTSVTLTMLMYKVFDAASEKSW